jgi:hypothetical protein
MAMDKVNIDIIGLKAPEGILTSPDNIIAGKAVPVGRWRRDIIIERNSGLAYAVVNLGAKKDFMTAVVGLECPADHLFRLSAGIYVTGIKKINTGIQRTVQHLG